MATDYISREAAIDAIWKPEVRPNDLIFDALRRACEEEVKHIPAADVRPVRKGHYIIDDMGDSSCSECGERYLDVTKRFCPECGAEIGPTQEGI